MNHRGDNVGVVALLVEQVGDAEDQPVAIQVEFELKGLGSAGPDTEGRLRRAILGYDRDDLYLLPPAPATAATDSGDDDSTPDLSP